MPATAPFTPKALAFLRALKRNNRREWFHERRDEYEQLLRAPMMAVVERLRAGVPELRARPDGRPEEEPLPHLARHAVQRRQTAAQDQRRRGFPASLGDRHTSAGLYLEISPEWVFAGGGLYMPDPQGLHRIRERIAKTPRPFARVVNAAGIEEGPAACKASRSSACHEAFRPIIRPPTT